MNLFKEAQNNIDFQQRFQDLTNEKVRIIQELEKFDSVDVKVPILIDAYFLYTYHDEVKLDSIGTLRLGLPQNYEYGYIVTNRDIDILLVDAKGTGAVTCDIEGNVKHEYRLDIQDSYKPKKLLTSGRAQQLVKAYEYVDKN